MKPKLPRSVEESLPEDIVGVIYSFVPHMNRRKKQHSPSLQKELERIQNTQLKGKSGNYMKGLSGFCLD